MQVLAHDQYSIKYTNGYETYHFLNLASVDYYNVGDKNPYWVLIGYKRQEDDGFDLKIGANVHQNGTYSEIAAEYRISNIIRRRIVLDSNECVEKDYVSLTNPFNIYDASIFRADIPSPISISDYLSFGEKEYHNEDTYFHNNVLSDELVEEFIACGKQISHFLNTFGEDSLEKIEEFQSNFGGNQKH